MVETNRLGAVSKAVGNINSDATGVEIMFIWACLVMNASFSSSINRGRSYSLQTSFITGNEPDISFTDN